MRISDLRPKLNFLYISFASPFFIWCFNVPRPLHSRSPTVFFVSLSDQWRCDDFGAVWRKENPIQNTPINTQFKCKFFHDHDHKSIHRIHLPLTKEKLLWTKIVSHRDEKFPFSYVDGGINWISLCFSRIHCALDFLCYRKQSGSMCNYLFVGHFSLSR